ncbi:MAG: lysozyme [Bacteroidales bacterium]|nr:lysozyme [Bacteroidales bacterium]
MRNILTLLTIAFTMLLTVPGKTPTSATLPGDSPQFEKAVEIIKKYETLHKASHWPLIGYGHRVQKGENYKKGVVLSQKEAENLLRSDLRKLCAMYSSFGPDSILLAALAYNCGPGTVARSSVYKKLLAGDRDIETAYKAHCRYRGKVLSGLKKRREEEFAELFYKG